MISDLYMDKIRNKDKLKASDITILGGSFNPVHNGHIKMAQTAHDQFGLDNIVFMPNKSTYYKDNNQFVSDAARLEMLRLATEDYDYMTLSDMEIKRGGTTHTIDTVRELLNENEDRTIYFIIGGDSLEWIDKWVEGDKILESVILLTAVRGETDIKKSNEIINKLYELYPNADILLLDMDDTPISSSDIRHRVESENAITGLVPQKVEQYILDNKLYWRA